MAYNGDGTFSFPFSWVLDAANGIPITASRMDTQFSNCVSGFDLAMTRDGQGVATATIPFIAGITTDTVAPFTALGPVSFTAGQIQFPATQNASTNANTLDDYEEGVDTSLTDNLGAGSTGVCVYNKIGNLVTGQGFITWAAGIAGSGAPLKIQGFPFNFAMPSSIGASIAITYWASFGGAIQAVADSATTVSLYEATAGITVKGNSGLAGLTTQFIFSYRTTQ